MPKITHPSMGRTGAGSVPQPTQGYVVDDPTDMPSNIPPAVAQNIEAYMSRNNEQAAESDLDLPGVAPVTKPKPKVDRSKLESLLFIGRVTTEVELFGHRFEISTLSNKEHNTMAKELYKFAEGADLFTVRILVLGHALKSIDGVSLDDIEIDGEFDSDYHKRMAVLDGMQLSLIEALYEEYGKLDKDEKDASESEEVKNS